MKNHKFKINLLHIIFSVLVLAIISISAPAQELNEAQDDKTLSPYFFVQGDPSVDQLPLKDTRVDIAVSGVIADVRVVQIYKNEGSRPINATYVFPASTRAAVYSMRMKIGNQVIVAKIKEREKAQQIFETAKKEGKSASLLEETRPNVFTMRLANIMPGDQVDIELRYTELLVPTDGTYELVYPTVVGPRYPSRMDTNGTKKGGLNTAYLHQGNPGTSSLHINARISGGVLIEEVTCISHHIAVERPSRSVAQLTLDDADPIQGNRDFVVRYRLAGDQIKSGLILYQSEDENFFLYMAQPPQRVQSADIPPREYIFVVDVSGSMEGFPLDTSKQLLRNLVGGLRETDFFNVVLFAGDSTALSRTPLQANQQNIQSAIDLLDKQRGAGGTELLPAMQQAMGLPREPGVARNIVLITDGFISGEQGVFDYIRGNLGKSNVFAFGIGSSVNRYLIEGVAKAGLGEPFIVLAPMEAPGVAEKFREYIQSPVMTNIQFKTTGFDIYDVFPNNIPDMLAQRPIVVFGKWRGSIGGTIELTGRTGLGEYMQTVDVSAADTGSDNPALRYLWARNRIAELSDYGSSYLSEQKISEITALGLRYNLLTAYTSFVAVREKVVNPGGSANDIDQPLPPPLEVSAMAVGSEPELIFLIGSLALIATLFMLRRRRNIVNEGATA